MVGSPPPQFDNCNIRLSKLILVLLLFTNFQGLLAQSSGIGFIQNQGQLLNTDGQVNNSVSYYTHTGNQQFYMQNKTVSYVWSNFQKAIDSTMQDSISSYRVDWIFEGANDASNIVGRNQISYANYYLAHTPNGLSDVPIDESVVYTNLYPGIMTTCTSVAGGIAYQFNVQSGYSVSDLRFQIKGATNTRISKGQFFIESPYGDMVYDVPNAYQIINGVQVNVTIDWMLNNGSYTFNIGTHDASVAILIDINPIIVTSTNATAPQKYWCTFVEGNYDDVANDVWVFEPNPSSTTLNTNIFTTGKTFGNNFPVLAGYSIFYYGGGDAFVGKFGNNRGRVWVTYFGGTSNDEGKAIAVTNDERVYFTGQTSSGYIPAIANCTAAWDNTIGPLSSIFVVRLNGAGQLNYLTGGFATYFGGNLVGPQEVHCMTVDKFNNVYFGGIVASSIYGNPSGNFPYVAGPGYTCPFTVTNCGSDEGFIAKANAYNNLVWCTAIGGDNSAMGGVDCEEVNAMVTDANGNLYVTGSTGSYGSTINSGLSTIMTPGAFPLVRPSWIPTAYVHDIAGGTDAYVIEFDQKNQIVWSTMYGGNGMELFFGTTHNNNGITIDRLGDIYITGTTNSTTLPYIPFGGANGYNQPVKKGGSDVYIARFNPKYSLEWSTYYGSNVNDYGLGIASHGSDKIYVSGWMHRPNTSTTVSAFPLKAIPGSYYQSIFGGLTETYIGQFDIMGNWTYGTYCGGVNDDFAYGVDTDSKGINIVTVGQTISPNFPVQDIPGTADYFDGILNATGLATNTAAYICNLLDNTVPSLIRLANTEKEVVGDLYPNPARQTCIFSNKEKVFIQSIQIINNLGQVIKEVAVNSADEHIAFDILGVSKGLYFVNLKGQDFETTLKLLIE